MHANVHYFGLEEAPTISY